VIIPSVGDNILNELKELLPSLDSSKIARLSGSNKYETSLNVCKYFALNSNTALIASGKSFADALSGSALAQSLNSPIILTNGTDISLQKNYLDSSGYNNLILIGGNSSISNDIEETLSAKKIDNTIITFPDKNLEALIRKSINKPNGDIYTSDVEKIEKIESNPLDVDSIYDLSGIDKLTNLKELNLPGNKIKNLEPLKDMINLTNISLSSNELTDISALKNLTNLTTLRLFSNNISNIDVLENLNKLQTLDLSENKITNIYPLKNLTNLEKAYLSYNNISNIDPLKDLVNLNELYLQSNNFIDINPLKGLIKLGRLVLDSNEVNKSQEDQLNISLPHCGVIVAKFN
jgi:Leucine-rich repeat (LRR) protein